MKSKTEVSVPHGWLAGTVLENPKALKALEVGYVSIPSKAIIVMNADHMYVIPIDRGDHRDVEAYLQSHAERTLWDSWLGTRVGLDSLNDLCDPNGYSWVAFTSYKGGLSKPRIMDRSFDVRDMLAFIGSGD